LPRLATPGEGGDKGQKASATDSERKAPAGAKAAHALPVKKLKRAFAVVLLALASYMLYKGVGAWGLI
jgi:hypothetical protein